MFSVFAVFIWAGIQGRLLYNLIVTDASQSCAVDKAGRLPTGLAHEPTLRTGQRDAARVGRHC